MKRDQRFASVKVVHNRDIYPKGAEDCPAIEPLVNNVLLWREFEKYEARANRDKLRYSIIGKLCVTFIGLSALYAAFRWVADDLALYQAIDAPVIVLGLTGLLLDIFLRASGLKRSWLINRFAAERIRSINFQLYSYATVAKDVDELSQLVAKKAAASIDLLRDEVGFPNAALDNFDPTKALGLDEPQLAKIRTNALNGELMSAAIAGYKRWRTQYQNDFATSMKGDLASKQRLYTSLSDGLFFVGAAVIVLTLITRALLGDLGPESSDRSFLDWIEATGIALFIMTAVAGVLSTGAAHVLDRSRYHQYQRDTARLLERDPQNAAEFLQHLREMEMLALRELDDFWRDSWISSYL